MGHGRNPQRVLLAALLLVASPARASASWRTSWAAAPAPSMAAAPGVPPEGVSPIFDNQTVVQTVRLSAGGVRLRLRLSNAYGAVPLTVGHVTIALVGPDGRARGGGREVTFGGASGVRIPPHAPALSDPVDLATGSFGRVQVSLYLPEDVERCTCHAVGLQAAQISPTGDYTDRAFTPVSTTQARAFFSAVEVESSAPAPVIVTLGDSITDGWRSTAGADRRWTDRLAERLAAAGHPAFVANEGLSGNRLLSDGAIPIFGESALTRFDRDVLAQPGATHLVVLEGVNDLGGSPSPSADAMIAGYRQLMARARDPWSEGDPRHDPPLRGRPLLQVGRRGGAVGRQRLDTHEPGGRRRDRLRPGAARPRRPGPDAGRPAVRRLAAPQRRRLSGYGRRRPAWTFPLSAPDHGRASTACGDTWRRMD